MAKKSTTKKNVVSETVNVETKETILEVKPEVKNENKSSHRRSIHSDYSMGELVAYEKAARMLCVQYEKIINIDEMERRNQITPNREKFMRLSSLHKKIMNAMENKVLELEKYEG